jgi:hypothetical protein
MATPFTLTQQPIRVTAPGYQPIYLAMDISGFDVLDVELGVVGLEGTATPSVTVELWTGMQNQTDDGYVQLVAFANQTTTNVYLKQSIGSGLLRYLRWKVTTLGGTSPAATFFIRGMGRSYT